MATGIEGSIEIGRRIRDLRENKGITQKDFARLLDVTQGRVSQIERGASIPEGMLPVLCSIFKVDKEYILTGKSDDGVGREYQDSDKNYRNAVDFALWNHNYKKVKHPIPVVSNMKLDNADPDYKAIASILRKCDCTITVHSLPIVDNDCIDGSGEVLYPETEYTFAIRSVAVSMGYNWEAFEIDRKIKHYGNSDSSDLGMQRDKVIPDEVDFVPYYFKMFTPTLEPTVFRNRETDKTYVANQDKLWRYRSAVDKARFLNHHVPQSLDDDYFINRECPASIRYNSDGSIDWDGEYCRFLNLISDGVSGKTFIRTGEPVNNEIRSITSVVFSGKEHDLGSWGRIGIESDRNGHIEFIIDDRRVTSDQLMDLLSMYEGHTIKFEMVSH